MSSGGGGKVKKLQATAVNADKEEKIPSLIPVKVLSSSLFNFEHINLYIDNVQRARALMQKNEIGSALFILSQLIKACPDYPEAYVALGDAFSKNKKPDLAAENYKLALTIAPFDVDTLVKHALQEQIVFSDNKPDITPQLAKAKEFKKLEKSFRSWYHSKLRCRFLELKINSNCALTKDNVDFQDIFLSKTAVRDAFFGFQAWQEFKYDLAEYYFASAIIKYNEDFISWGALAYLVFTAREINDADFTQIAKVADNYSYSIAYFTLFLYHYEKGEIETAHQDLRKFLSVVDRYECEFFDSHKKTVIEFLLEHTKSEELNNEQADAAEKEICSVSLAIATKGYKENIDSKIELLNSLIRRTPFSHSLYNTLAKFHVYKGEEEEAIVKFSLAIWLCPTENLRENYYNRAKCFLQLGKTLMADLDFERSLGCLTYIKKIVKALHNFADHCLKLGRKNFEEDEFATAELIFCLGITRKLQALNDKSVSFVSIAQTEDDNSVLKKLYLGSVEAKEKLGETDENIKNYIFKVITNFKLWDDKSLASLREKYDFYAKRVERARDKSILATLSPQIEIKPTLIVVKQTDKRQNFFKATPPCARGNQPAIKATNPEPDFLEVFDVDLEKPIKPEEEIKRDKNLRESAKKQRIREKKQQRLQNRKQNKMHQDDLSSSDSEDAAEISALITNPEITNIKSIMLNDFENKVFAMIIELVPEELRKNYKIYLGGGWAYDKIRKEMLGLPVCKYNDFDLRTNIPAVYLEKLFKPVAEVKDLFVLMVDNIKIDVVYEPDIDNLKRIAKYCDFLSLFIDPEGGVHDLNGFGLIYMQKQQLYSSVPPAEIFKDDPLRIFRAIYTATKRQCRFTTIRKQIHQDRDLLVPRLSNDNESAVDNILNPHRFNIWIGKLFSQGMAITNFALLQKKKFNLLEVLFPSIYAEMLADIDWIKNQMVISNHYSFPKVAIIYATFITSALALRIPVLILENKLIKTEPLIQAATDIYESSLLFKDAYTSVDELFGYLQRTFLDWRAHHELLVPVPEPEQETYTESPIRRLGRG